LWQFVRRLNREGQTVVLTTHYLEEAELYCNRIAMLKDGRIAALDSTRNLLETFSGLEVRLSLDSDRLPEPFPAEILSHEGPLVTLRLSSARDLEAVLARLRESGISIVELELQPPDLEDVFLRLTGRQS
jgi:ABC-2 type transport system ATP-binding protein